jgi:DNA-binding NarL/FixJ family response regulator
VVTSELVLVAETVGVGLVERGFDAAPLDWPAEPPGDGGHRGRAAGADVGLLISDLGSWKRLRTAWLLVARNPLPWVVVTTAPQGPMWGAALDAGACVVLPGTVGLKQVCRAVKGAARGTVHTLPADQDVLVAQWGELLERREVICHQVSSLTPREHEVLTMLHAGDRISRIAQLLGISPVTVRSQVKSVLRKLDVKSQLGAVAALDDLLALGDWVPRPARDGADDSSPDCGRSGSWLTLR